jgi:16S rRNA processing protein RimM
MRATETQMVMIGEILRSHGLRGVVKIRATTDDPQRFFLLQRVQLQRDSRTLGEYTLERVQVGNDGVFVKFHGISNRHEADQLRGTQVMISRAECLPTEPDQFYTFDIIGLPVYTITGIHLGEIVGIEAFPANDVWVVRNPDSSGQEWLIPAIKSVIQQVDLKNRRVVIEPIPGLLNESP